MNEVKPHIPSINFHDKKGIPIAYRAVILHLAYVLFLDVDLALIAINRVKKRVGSRCANIVIKKKGWHNNFTLNYRE